LLDEPEVTGALHREEQVMAAELPVAVFQLLAYCPAADPEQAPGGIGCPAGAGKPQDFQFAPGEA
jgi:hypothetical protein